MHIASRCYFSSKELNSGNSQSIRLGLYGTPYCIVHNRHFIAARRMCSGLRSAPCFCTKMYIILPSHHIRVAVRATPRLASFFFFLNKPVQFLRHNDTVPISLNKVGQKNYTLFIQKNKPKTGCGTL